MQRINPKPLLDTSAWDEAVPDRYWLAYLIMYLLGVGSLLPWNTLITPTEYFQLRLAGSPFEGSFESILSTSFTATSFVMVTWLQSLQRILSLRLRILGGLALLLLSIGTLMVLAIHPLFYSDAELLEQLANGATSQFYALVLCGALCGIGQAFLTVSAMSYAALFKRPTYLQAVSGGQGVAGLSVALANIILKVPSTLQGCSNGDGEGAAGAVDVSRTTATHAREVVVAAATYFTASCVVVLLCVLGFIIVERLPFTRARKRMGLATPFNALRPPDSEAGSSTSRTSPWDVPPLPPRDAAGDAVGAAGATPLQAVVRHDDELRAAADASVGSVQLATELWKWSVSIFFVYTVTIAIFPSLTVTIVASSGSCAWKALFVPIGFAVFNLGDTIGRNLPCILTSQNTILGAVCARLLFAPLFMLCYTGSAADGEAGPLQLPVFGLTDALPWTFMLAFSVSNGWLTSSVFVASQSAVEPGRREQAASLLVCLLNSGIFFGAMLSFVVRYLVRCRL